MSIERLLLQNNGFAYCEEAVVVYLRERLKHENYAMLQERLYYLRYAAREWVANGHEDLFLTLPADPMNRLCVVNGQGRKVAWLNNLPVS